MSQEIVQPRGPIRGELLVPGDKSVSHRALMIGGLSKGITTVTNLSPSADVMSTLSCLRALGVEIKGNREKLQIQGSAFRLKTPDDILDVGNSGTTIRLMSGILAGQNFSCKLTGDDSLRKRDMNRVISPLKQMGASFDSENGHAPLSISGGKLHGICYEMPVASAQVKSAILLAGLQATGKTEVIEPMATRDHTERMLRYFGVPVEKHGAAVSVRGRSTLSGCEIAVPGDLSSAAFFIAAALLVPESELVLKNVGVNPTRMRYLEVLKEMGGDLTIIPHPQEVLEPQADIVCRTSKLKSIELSGTDIPLIIDELPILAVLAANATGITLIRDASELRGKESDRIRTVVNNLAKMGVQVEELSDGMRIVGGTKLHGASLDTYHDHRIAMAFAIAGLTATGETTLHGTEWVDVSYPGFFQTLNSLS